MAFFAGVGPGEAADGPTALGGSPDLLSFEEAAALPSARSIITIAIVSGLTFLAIDHLKARGGVGARVGSSRIGVG